MTALFFDGLIFPSFGSSILTKSLLVRLGEIVLIVVVLGTHGEFRFLDFFMEGGLPFRASSQVFIAFSSVFHMEFGSLEVECGMIG